MKSGGPGGKTACCFTSWDHLSFTLINQVVQEVYRCCFTWDTQTSYYSDEIRWSEVYRWAVLLGTPVILLWWNQVVQEVCRCCLLGTSVILLWWNQSNMTDAVLLGTPSYYSDEITAGLQCCFTWDVILLWWNQVVQR